MPDDRADSETRPSPEALLREVSRETRGRLKVFLGAAPGVGKTYEMLRQARQRKLEGVDVVIGVVETHGRVETDLISKGLEIIPKKRSPYKGRVFAEMDLDALLQRRPKLAVVDELAHTNIEGSRHPKRYMDVEELLAAGVDVYTTLNVQHLESLNDVVARITQIRVRETVPDSILDRADDVELVDITPDDLIQRLKEGKVYLPQTAERAVQSYFVPGNLQALRELALRRTAQRVDDQMINYMRAHAIHGPWEASERVLVCVNDRPGSVALVRYARRLADRLRASWTAIYVETSRTERHPKAERDRVGDALRAAERLGAQAITVQGADVADAAIHYAHENNFTHIVVSTAQRSWWSELLRRSAAHRIIRRAGDISVHVVPEQLTRALKGPPEKRQSVSPPASAEPVVQAYVSTAAIVAVALAIGLVFQRFGITNVALVFLTGVLVTAIRYGLWPSLFACLAAILAYNFFFMPPLYTFTISDPDNVVALFFFTTVALLASYLSSRLRGQALLMRERATATENLYLFSRKLASVYTLDDLLWATSYQIAQMLKTRVVILLPQAETLVVRGGYPPEDTLDDADLAAAKWVGQNGKAAGRGADTLPGAKRLFLPLRTGRGVVAVIGLEADREEPLLSPDQRRLFDALANQCALALERIQFAEDSEKARVASETERLRGALLTSISHDLRTPLSAILGSATALRSQRESLDRIAQDELVGTIQEEAERLNRFITNLLDMTRLESGALAPRSDHVDITDMIGSALRRAGKVLGQHRVDVSIAPDVPMLRVDPVLFEQVLFNLLDNAAKYAPSGSEIRVIAARNRERVTIEIADEGEGIPIDDLERVFDKFYRVRAADKKTGTGLGLAICRGFVESMGGTIRAGNRTDRRGALFTIVLPVPERDLKACL